MNIQTIETKPISEKEISNEEEPPLPNSKILNITLQKLIKGWEKMIIQGIAT